MPSAATLGLPNVRGRIPLLAGLAIDSFGGGCAGPLLLLFFVRVADIPLGTAGLLLTVATLFSIAAPAVVGQVIDRVGPRNLVIGAQFAQGLAFAGFFFGRSTWLLFLCALVTTTGQRVFWSSVFSLLSDVSDAGDRDRWFGLGGMMQAGGFGLGALAAGALLTFDGDRPFLIAMALNAATFFVAGLLLLRIHAGHAARSAEDSGPAPLLRKDRPFLVLIGANTILALCTMLMGIGLPVYVSEALPAPKWLVGVLLAAVSVVLATGQTLVVRHTEKRRRTNVMIVAGLLWAVWGVMMAGLLHLPAGLVVPVLLLGTAVFAAADVLHAATSNALAAAIAPERGRGKYLSYWQYSFTFASVLVPAFFAQLFEVRREFPWLAISLLALVAAGTILVLDRVLPQATTRRS
ncbi:major facilitator superfamily MFS_1 [Kribbella flavida DSM 17836]|uniref:Major facilitator superfamily MFS_1 n=1 Tax=Kribbella flavida (strain DSM 17836 / JCM 10339 / NBRC 14399) TaxID=479435 RepID=D2PT34_KRIFD|nr:MFS transporter [Kribbella flavida]ADB29350.1 major facilitator superfamily MFS_1 [Kribbella flavida DSM 17836]